MTPFLISHLEFTAFYGLNLKRVWEHKNKVIPERFTAQYNVPMLVYYELHGNYMEVAHREQRFKNWCWT